MSEVSLEVAQEHGLTADEYQHAIDVLGRVPTWVELGVLSVMWSEHCAYKSSRVHLSKFPTEAPWVIEGPGENAGVIDVGDGLAVAFKMESHNHPSFIEPYQGAATGVGGIMRDVFTMGARPIANLNSLRFGRPEAPRMRFLVEGVVAGIGGYGNCMGVPTVGGEVYFDASYDGNILVNAFTLGVVRTDKIFRSAAAGVGNPVMYVGSKTGRDGIHGATMASEGFGEGSEEKRPRVQVGDPFTEKKLLEACLELMQGDAVIAIQDMGAAGLTSSSCEMASKGEVGIEIDVAKVPRREKGMTAYEVMLSESQERMLMVVRPGKEPEVERIFDKWDLSSAVIGVVTDSRKVVVKDGETEVASLPVALIVDEAPKYDRPQARPDLESKWALPDLAEDNLEARLLGLLAQPTIASKRWIWEQYDHSVRSGTVLGPGQGDAAVVRLPDAKLRPSNASRRGVAMTVDVNPRFVGQDPERGAALAIIEAARNLVCTGAEPKAATDCLNFGNPEVPEVMWSFARAVEGMAAACAALDTPIVSGNVSLYNETEGRPILPTPTVGMVGIVDDIAHATAVRFRADAPEIMVLGWPDDLSFGASELVLMESGHIAGRPVEPNFDRSRALHGLVLQSIRDGQITSAHDVSEGGLLVAVAESCLAGDVGARIQLPADESARHAFGEGPDVIVVSCTAEQRAVLQSSAKAAGVPIAHLGEVGGANLVVEDQFTLSVASLKSAHDGGLVTALKITKEPREGGA